MSSKAVKLPLVCTSAVCAKCGIYQLCYAVGGDTDLSTLDTLVKKRKILKRGEFLFREGKPFQAIYAVRTGSIKTSMLADDGRNQITGFHDLGKVLGLDAVVTGTYNCEAVAMETTAICEVPFTNFEELCKKIPELQQKMLEIMSLEILDNRDLMLLLGKMTAEERLAACLLNMAKSAETPPSSSSRVNLSMSRSDIGNYLGMAEETVCRILTRFQEEGLITIQRRQITLNDVSQLKSVSRRK